MPRILVVGTDPSVLARSIRTSRRMGFDVVGVRADADLRHLWRNQRFDAIVLRQGIGADTRTQFLAEIGERDPELPIFHRNDSDEEMARFLESVVEDLET